MYVFPIHFILSTFISIFFYFFFLRTSSALDWVTCQEFSWGM